MTLQTRTIVYATYCLVVAAASWVPLRALYELSQRDNTASHVVLIPLISIALVLMRRKAIFRGVTQSLGAGTAIVAVGALLLALTLPLRGDGGTHLSLVVAPAVVLWIGGFVVFYGISAARAALFPLLFLAFMVPVPSVALQAASDFLKNGSTETVDALFSLTGTPHLRNGYVFSLPYFAIEVADACSGIRSSIGLLITSLLAGHLFLRTAWTKTILTLVVVPITIFKNAVRIVTLSLLSIHVDRSYLTGQLHHEGGIVFFVISLALLMPVLLWLMRSERPAGSSSQIRKLRSLNPRVSGSTLTP